VLIFIPKPGEMHSKWTRTDKGYELGLQ